MSEFSEQQKSKLKWTIASRPRDGCWEHFRIWSSMLGGSKREGGQSVQVREMLVSQCRQTVLRGWTVWLLVMLTSSILMGRWGQVWVEWRKERTTHKVIAVCEKMTKGPSSKGVAAKGTKKRNNSTNILQCMYYHTHKRTKIKINKLSTFIKTLAKQNLS